MLERKNKMRVQKASEFSAVGKSVGFVIFFLVGAMPTAAVHAAPVTTDVMWKADEAGNPSGAWADENHWDGGQVPGALKFAKFNLNTNYEVRVENDLTTLSSMWLMPNYRRMVRFNGRGATFTQPSTTTANYADAPFALRIQHPTSATAFYTLFNVSCNGVFTNAISHLEDFDLSVGYTNGEWRADFNHGTFNFANPEDNTPGWAKKCYHTLFEYAQPGNKQGIYLHAGSSVTLATLRFQGSAAESTICADGGTHYVDGYIYAPMQTTYCATDRTVSSIISTGSGTAINLNGASFISQSGRTPSYNASKRVYRYVAKDGGALNVNGSVDHYRGDFYLGAENGGVLTVNKAIKLAIYAAQTGTLYAVNATIDCPSPINGTDQLQFGEAGETDGIGRILLTNSTMTCNPNIMLYRGYVYMTNSTFSAKHVFRLGRDTDYETTFTVDDSTATVSGAPINVGYSTGRGRLVLRNGAHLNADSITSDSGLGVFEADGATLSPVGARSAFFGGLAAARIGANGLTIDADYNVTIAQPFSDADDAPGEGRLVLAGSATKKLTGDLSGVSTVEAVEGVVDITGNTVSNLVVDGCTLAVDPSNPITVVGDVDFGTVRLALNSAADYSEPVVVARFAHELSADSLLAWEEAVAVSGVASGKVCVLAQVAESGGYALTAQVRDAVTTSIEVKEGVSNIVDGIAFAAADTLSVVVSNGAALNASGVLRRGALEKRGDGPLHLSGLGNLFVPGVFLYGGLLSAADFAALGIGQPDNTAAGTLADGVVEVLGPASGAVQDRAFQVSAANDATAVVFKNEVDWEMPVPSVTKGSIIKRGAGRLVWNVSGTQTFGSKGDGNGSSQGGFWPQAAASIAPLVFDDVNGGQPTSGVFMPFTVAEGEVVIKGSGSGATLKMPGSVAIGMPTAQGTAEPGLVLDNVELNYYTYACHFSLGPGLKYASANDFAMGPYLVLTNNATLNGLVMMVSRFGKASATNRVVVDSSTIAATSTIYPNRSQDEHPVCEYDFRNGSRLIANTITLFRDFTMRFDASTLAKDANLSPTAINNEINNKICTGNFEFRNGSLLCCSTIASQSAGRNSPLTLTFDNSEWRPAASGDFTFNWTDTAMVLVKVEGVGLVLDVPDGATWTMNTSVNGDGGIVKKGPGTLALGASAVAYSGVTRIDEGVVDLGGNAQPLRVAGAGTVRNGTIANGGIAISLSDDGTVSGDIPTLDGVAVSGRFKVDVGREGATAELAQPYREVAVAAYTGAAPSVAGWRIVNSGQKHLGATFEARGGYVYMTPMQKGAMLIVR